MKGNAHARACARTGETSMSLEIDRPFTLSFKCFTNTRIIWCACVDHVTRSIEAQSVSAVHTTSTEQDKEMEHVRTGEPTNLRKSLSTKIARVGSR